MDRAIQSHPASVVLVLVNDLSVDLINKIAKIGSTVLRLEPRELQLLLFLAQRYALAPNEVVLKDEIWRDFFPKRDEPDTNLVEVQMCKLRKKMREASGGKGYIRTFSKRGYKLSAHCSDC